MFDLKTISNVGTFVLLSSVGQICHSPVDSPVSHFLSHAHSTETTLLHSALVVLNMLFLSSSLQILFVCIFHILKDVGHSCCVLCVQLWNNYRVISLLLSHIYCWRCWWFMFGYPVVGYIQPEVTGSGRNVERLWRLLAGVVEKS